MAVVAILEQWSHRVVVAIAIVVTMVEKRLGWVVVVVQKRIVWVVGSGCNRDGSGLSPVITTHQHFLLGCHPTIFL